MTIIKIRFLNVILIELIILCGGSGSNVSQKLSSTFLGG